MDLLKVMFPQVDPLILRGALLSHMDNIQDAVDWIIEDILPGLTKETEPNGHLAVAGLSAEYQLDDIVLSHQLFDATVVHEPVGAPEVAPGALRETYAGAVPAVEDHLQQFQNISADSRLPVFQSQAHAPDVPPGLESNLDQVIVDQETEHLPQEVIDQVGACQDGEQPLATIEQVDSGGDEAVGPVSVDRIDNVEWREQDSEERSTDEVNSRQEVQKDQTNEKNGTIDQPEEAAAGPGGGSGGSGEERGSEAEVPTAESWIVTGGTELPLWQSLSGSTSMAASGMEEDLRCRLEEAIESKNALVEEIERAKSLLEDVAMAESCALQWEESAVSAGLQSMAVMEEIRREVAGAREALESRSGELFAERGILSSEVRDLRDRLAGVEAARKAAHSSLREIKDDLDRRLAVAQMREARARLLCEDHQKSMAAIVAAQREELAKIRKQADELEEEAQECRRIQKLLRLFDSSDDSFKADIMGLSDIILAIKAKSRSPPGSLSAPLVLTPGEVSGQSSDIAGSQKSTPAAAAHEEGADNLELANMVSLIGQGSGSNFHGGVETLFWDYSGHRSEEEEESKEWQVLDVGPTSTGESSTSTTFSLSS